MSAPASPRHPLIELLGSARMAQSLATIGVAAGALPFPLHQLMGWAGYLAAVMALIAFMIASFVLRREQVDWRGIPPISLLLFLLWTTCSLAWSNYQWATAGGLAYLAAYTVIGLYIAFNRDTFQIVRSFGDALRFVLVAALALEVFAGFVIDHPIHALGVTGGIPNLQPIAGLTSSRDQLGLLAIIGAITFATEHRTRSVPRGVSIGSLAVAALCIVFTWSPVVEGATAVVGVAAALILGVRRVPAERRQAVQFVILGGTIVGLALAWVYRGAIVRLFNANGVLDFRLQHWQAIVKVVQLRDSSLQGGGWIGPWQPQIFPFSELTTAARPANTALNAFVDVWFQLGVIGLVFFAATVGLAFSRSWLLAGRRRSVVYAWPAATMIALGVISLAESSILTEFGWTCLVICSVKASRELSWRSALREPSESVPPAF